MPERLFENVCRAPSGEEPLQAAARNTPDRASFEPAAARLARDEERPRRTDERAGAVPEAPTRLFDGRLLLRQPKTGHRAGTDAVLLATAAVPESNSTFVDVGAGVGTVGVALARRDTSLTGHLVEQDAALADLAQQNVVLNGVDGRVAQHRLDLFDRGARAALGLKAALVVTNPPFFLAGQSRASADPGRAAAHVLAAAASPVNGHAAWLLAALSFLGPHGRLVMIHRPDALPALLAAAAGRLGGIMVRPVHAYAGQAAIRMLFAGTVGSRAAFSIVDALILHRDDGSFTEEAERLHRGETSPCFAKKKSRPLGPAPSSRRRGQHTLTR